MYLGHHKLESVTIMVITVIVVQMAEAALADEWVINGDRVALQRRVLRLGKPPRRWKRPPWAAAAMREPLEVGIPVTKSPVPCQHLLLVCSTCQYLSAYSPLCSSVPC